MNICKRSERKEIDPESDIPKSTRIICILQLCIAFSTLLWILGAPFTESLYENKKLRADLEWITQQNPEQFNEIPLGTQREILKLQEKAQKKLEEPALGKIVKSLKGLFFDIPISKQLWLILSLVLPILVMKQIEGAREVFLLLPILAGVYAWQISPQSPAPSIYPSESYLEKTYLDRPIGGSLEFQREQLEQAWQAYLVAEWSKLSPEHSETEKMADGLYHFIVQKTLAEKNVPTPKPGPWTLGLYLLWNLFAGVIVIKPALPRMRLCGCKR